MFYACEMEYKGAKLQSDLQPTPFDYSMFEEYKNIYNECFYDMRKALGVEPYNFLSSKEQLKDKTKNIYILYDNDLIGAVGIYGSEIDDLIVNKKHQKQGYGKQLLTFAIVKMQEQNINPIKLHVAKCNENAVKIYEKMGFECVKVEEINL